MPARKIRRHSRPVRNAAKAFNRFAERLASLISDQVLAALQAAVDEAQLAEAQRAEAQPATEQSAAKPPPRKARPRRRRRAVVPAPPAPVAAPKVIRRPARPPVENAPATHEAPIEIAAPPATVSPEPAPPVEPDEPQKHSVTKPPDRMTRIRDSFRPGKVAVFDDEPHVVLDVPEDEPVVDGDK